jgi:hypothetical protein
VVLVETFSRGTLDPRYVTGFVEGNGSFTYSRSGRQLSLYFAVKLPEIDRGTLEELRHFFGGAGRIYPVGAGRSAYYRISHRAELLAVVHHFDAYPLRTHKHDAYVIWRQMVLAKQQFRNPDRSTLAALAAQLSALPV